MPELISAIKEFFSSFHPLIAGLVGAIVSGFIYKIWHKHSANHTIEETPTGEEILIYTRKARPLKMPENLLKGTRQTHPNCSGLSNLSSASGKQRHVR